MKSSWLAASWVAGLLSVLVVASEVPAAIRGVDLPEYDAGGRLVRRLTARAARDLLKTPTLLNGRVEFFGGPGGTEPVARMDFADALYRAGTNEISGEGELTFGSASGTVSGRRFLCRMAEGWLELLESVEAEARGYRLSGRAARLRFDPKASAQEVVREVIVTGQVTVRPPAGGKLPREVVRMESIEARFKAEERRLLVRYPVTGWTSDGGRVSWENSGGDEFLPIDLGP